MKKRWIAVAAFGLSLLLGGSALAEGGYRTISAYMDDVHFRLNGSKLGQATGSLVYNGTVYVPAEEMAQMLGAQTSWDAAGSTLSLDFATDEGQAELSAVTQAGIYQYAAIENNAILKALVANFKTGDMKAAKTTIARYDALRKSMLGVPDAAAAGYLAKMKAAADMMRTGFSAHNFDNYYMAWSIYNTNASSLNSLLKGKLQAAAAAGDTANTGG